jgi:hypothetical protein
MFPLTLALGLAVVAAIALSPLYAPRLELARSIPLGSALVLAAIAFAVAWAVAPHHAGTSGRALLPVAFFLLLVGSLLLIADDEPGDDAYGPEPPWWPGFESDFRRYAARSRQSALHR